MHAPQGIRNRGYSIGTFLQLIFVFVASVIYSDCAMFQAIFVLFALYSDLSVCDFNCCNLQFDLTAHYYCKCCAVLCSHVLLVSTDRNGQHISRLSNRGSDSM